MDSGQSSLWTYREYVNSGAQLSLEELKKHITAEAIREGTYLPRADRPEGVPETDDEGEMEAFYDELNYLQTEDDMLPSVVCGPDVVVNSLGVRIMPDADVHKLMRFIKGLCDGTNPEFRVVADPKHGLLVYLSQGRFAEDEDGDGDEDEDEDAEEAVEECVSQFQLHNDRIFHDEIRPLLQRVHAHRGWEGLVDMVKNTCVLLTSRLPLESSLSYPASVCLNPRTGAHELVFCVSSSLSMCNFVGITAEWTVVRTLNE